MSKDRKFIIKFAVIVAFIVLAGVIGTSVIVINIVRHSQHNYQNVSGSIAAVHAGVAQPPSAKDVADGLGCTRFHDDGPSQIGGSIDSGYCWIGKQKYGINTFPSSDVRDAWLQEAEPLGVMPKWETDTSVVYPSVT